MTAPGVPATQTAPTVRLFVAAFPPPVAVDHLAAAVTGLAMARAGTSAGVRLAREEQWHLTLAFLGEVPASLVPVAERAMTDCAGNGAANFAADGAAGFVGPVTLRIGGAGRFDTAGRSGARGDTVVWAGLLGDTDRLGDLADRLRAAMRSVSVPFDPRPYRPHLTLARVGERYPRAELRHDLDRLDLYLGPQWTIEALCLVRSHRGPGRPPTYQRLRRAPLGPEGALGPEGGGPVSR